MSIETTFVMGIACELHCHWDINDKVLMKK